MSTLEEKAKAYAKAHNKRFTPEGFTPWKGYCASLMFRMASWLGKAPNPVPYDADAAAAKAGKLNKNFKEAKAGAFHYWSIGEYGHVGLDLVGGGTKVFMSSSRLSVKWNKAGDLGYTSIAQYNKGGGAKYLGWGMRYGKNGYVVK